MRLTIEDKTKLAVFVAILQLLKNWSSHINMHFEKDRLYIQSMDKSHICLADIEIKNKWFTSYDCSFNNNISVDSTQLSILMKYALKNDVMEIKYEDEHDIDKLYINLLNKKDDIKEKEKEETKSSFDHFFELNLMDVQEDELAIPKVNYDVEFTIDSKIFVEVLTELNTFGSDLNMKCSETAIELFTNGDSTKLKVNIPIDELDEYAVSEGENVDISFSLSHLCNMCLSNKISSNINISINNELPMSLRYNLGDDSKVCFYIAPKIEN